MIQRRRTTRCALEPPDGTQAPKGSELLIIVVLEPIDRSSNIKQVCPAIGRFRQICAEHSWDKSQVFFHRSGGGCYCACPEGPCQHVWDGPEESDPDEGWSSATCSRCGMSALGHDLRCSP